MSSSTTHYLDLLERLGQAAIATDRSGNITYWGPKAAALYGWTPDEVIGQSILDVTPTDVSRGRAEEILNMLGAGEVWSGEFQVRRRDGMSLAVSVTDVPIMTDEQFAGVIGVSAPRDERPIDVASVAESLSSAVNEIWPGHACLGSMPSRPAVRSSVPHMMQLWALLFLRALDMNSGSPIHIHITDADKSRNFFGDRAGIYVSLTPRAERPVYSLLRELRTADRQVHFARTLVSLVGGKLFLAHDALHLFIPTESGQEFDRSARYGVTVG